MISLDPLNSGLQFRCVQCLAQGPTVMKRQKPHVDQSGPAPEPTVRKEAAVSPQVWAQGRCCIEWHQMTAPGITAFLSWKTPWIFLGISGWNRQLSNPVTYRMWRNKYLVFFQKLWGECPRSISNDFIHIATVSQSFVSLRFIHHGETLEFVSEVITANWSR